MAVSTVAMQTTCLVGAPGAVCLLVLHLLFSQNGGEHGGNADNLPYRGSKASLFEGGHKALGFVKGPESMIKKTGYVNDGLFHVTDWVPTIMGLVDNKDFEADDLFIDGYDQSKMLTKGKRSKREDIVYSIDMATWPMFGQSAVRVGDWKFIWGCYGLSDGYGADVELFYENDEYRDGAALPPYMGTRPLERVAIDLSSQNVADMIVICNHYGWTTEDTNNANTTKFLFNLKDDPYEENDLSDDPAYADKVAQMKKYTINKLSEYRQAPNLGFSAAANPANFGGIWTPGWCEDIDILNDS